MRTSLYVLVLACVGCAGPRIWIKPGFNISSLEGNTVLVMPLSISDPLGDDRTGIMLSHGTIISAGVRTCRVLVEAVDEIGVLCFHDRKLVELRSAMSAIISGFAADQASPAPALRELSERSSARYMLLFRPEVAEGEHVVIPGGPEYSTSVEQRGGWMIITSTPTGGRTATKYLTRRGYQISAELVDLVTGAVVVYGKHRVLKTKMRAHARGSFEAAPILLEAMTELGEAVLGDE